MVSPSEFVTIQMARAGFYHRYRDFRVRDLAAFLENYQLTSNGELVQVAGRDCLQLAVARKDASSSYEVALDITTGQVLRYREFDATGALFSSMEYETYNANPDLTQVEFHQQTNQEQPLVSVADLGFSPLIPTLLPDASFTFLEASVVVDSSTGQKLAKFTFTDGVETIFFLDGGVAPITPPKFGAPPVAAGGGQGDSVNVFHEGALTVMWGQVQGHAVYLVGKVPQDELKQTLQSALR